MKKKLYIQPQSVFVGEETIDTLLANSIVGDGNSADLNPETMGEGNGSDAASRGSIWDDEF
ncbi:hypothetical protein L6475_02285 [Prevotella sp. E9-3]|uniref:hypothetical protein n=1 Tax=Prevotella sp. E9-3 TaxID=2913621 RepID=UPI001EDBCE00|nr:hypothetical protein [Prevotella sp. E9-3]UKK48822.1 hypothetical protein L6475_02285 [Prevotella sp. E9-3]